MTSIHTSDGNQFSSSDYINQKTNTTQHKSAAKHPRQLIPINGPISGNPDQSEVLTGKNSEIRNKQFKSQLRKAAAAGNDVDSNERGAVFSASK